VEASFDWDDVGGWRAVAAYLESDGKGNAVYAPKASGQVAALRAAYRVAGVSPDTIEMVEAHGTGTRVGDGVEASALTEVYQESGRSGTWCALGSVKSQIGHTKAAAGAAGLESAATAEFLFDSDRCFWFLEINTRLQVEHGVSELVAGIDIVREQLFVAAGRPLSEQIRAAAARAVTPDRHAIEVRLSAEDPARDFGPTPGRIGRWQMPGGPGVRVDTAVGAGERVPPDYDPLIAKILVVDADRPAAIRRLARALDETVVTGIQTTLPFHRAVIGDRFDEADLSIDWVDDGWAEMLQPGRAAALDAARLVAADLLARGGDGTAPVVTAGGGPTPAATASAWAQSGRVRAIDRWPG
jgi:hypothetical protein